MEQTRGTSKPEWTFLGSWKNLGLIKLITKIITVAAEIFLCLNAAHLFGFFNFFPPDMQINAMFLGAVLVVIFLTTPVTKKMEKGKFYWWDGLLALASIAVTGYIAINALDLMGSMKLTATPLETVFGVLTLLLVMEGVRRLIGPAMVVIGALFVLYMKFGSYLPGMWSAYPMSWPQVFNAIYATTQGMFGPILQIGSQITVIYLLFGTVLAGVGGGEFLINLALSLAGRFTGGSAKAAIVASALFGTLSGSPIANIAVSGSITIPLMKRTGYSSVYAAGVESAASTGGVIMPPVMGTLAFIMAIMTNTPYASIALAAVIPAVLYYVALYFQVDAQARRMGIVGLPAVELPSVGENFKKRGEFILPLVALILFLFVFRFDVNTSGLLATIVTIAICFPRKVHRERLKRLLDFADTSFRGTLTVGVMMALAGTILGTLVVSGLGPRVSSSLVTLAAGNLLILAILTAIVDYIMGMGVDIVGAYVLLAALVAPAMIGMGVPLLAAHFFIMYLTALGFFTPPLAPACFVAGAIAGASPMRAGLRAMRLGIVLAIVPFIIIWQPSLILIGSPLEIIKSALFAFVGVCALALGLEGYLFGKLKWGIMRIGLLVSGSLIIFPNIILNIIGLILFGLLFAWRRWIGAKLQPSKSS